MLIDTLNYLARFALAFGIGAVCGPMIEDAWGELRRRLREMEAAKRLEARARLLEDRWPKVGLADGTCDGRLSTADDFYPVDPGEMAAYHAGIKLAMAKIETDGTVPPPPAATVPPGPDWTFTESTKVHMIGKIPMDDLRDLRGMPTADVARAMLIVPPPSSSHTTAEFRGCVRHEVSLGEYVYTHQVHPGETVDVDWIGGHVPSSVSHGDMMEHVRGIIGTDEEEARDLEEANRRFGLAPTVFPAIGYPQPLFSVASSTDEQKQAMDDAIRKIQVDGGNITVSKPHLEFSTVRTLGPVLPPEDAVSIPAYKVAGKTVASIHYNVKMNEYTLLFTDGGVFRLAGIVVPPTWPSPSATP